MIPPPAAGRPLLHAFIDEAGQRSRSKSSSDHFVMSAVVIEDERLQAVSDFMADLRQDLGRPRGTTLHWRNLKKHAQKIRAAQALGSCADLTVCSVVVCKRHLTGPHLDEDQAYLYTFRFLLERLSWIARDKQRDLHYTLAHIQRFPLAKLRQYEANLRARYAYDCRVEWPHVPKGGAIDQPHRLEYLQLADFAASMTFQAVENDQFGNTESRYVHEVAPALWRRGTNANALTSYGLKVHPNTPATQQEHPWIAGL